jgi:anti-sigma factor (TIGR02949 family)
VDLSDVDCDEVLRDLEAFLDGELPTDRAGVIGDHLAECSPCLARGDFRRRLRVIVSEKCRPAVDLPPHLVDRVRRAIHDEHPA